MLRGRDTAEKEKAPKRGLSWCRRWAPKPVLWFPEKESAVETARVMADVRHQFAGKPTCVQAQDGKGAWELVFEFG